MKKMDIIMKVLVLLAAALVVVDSARKGISLTADFEDQPAKVGLKHEETDFSALAHLGKSGSAPRIMAKLKEDQKSEFGADHGKRGVLSRSNPGNCGKYPRFDRTGRKDENAPWMVLLGGQQGGRSLLQCPGVVVSDRHVLAPAFCAYANKVNFAVAPTSTGTTTAVEVATTNYFPNLSSTDDFLWGNNVAVLKLKTPLDFSERLQPACLTAEDATPESNVTYVNTIVYGYRNNNGKLEKLYFPMETHDPVALHKLLEDFNRRNPLRKALSVHLISSNHLGVIHNFDELLYTALFYHDYINNRFIVLGVGPVAVSLDEPVGLYTNVAFHRRWIDQVLRQ